MTTLRAQWEDAVKDLDFVIKFPNDEVNIYKTLLKNRVAGVDEPISKFCKKLEVKPVVFYGFLLNLNPILDLDLSGLTEHTHIHITFSYTLIYSLMQEKGRQRILDIAYWKNFQLDKHRAFVGILFNEVDEKTAGRADIFTLFDTCANFGFNVFIFAPKDVDLGKKTIKGTALFDKNWYLKEYKFPALIDNFILGEEHLELYNAMSEHCVFTRPFSSEMKSADTASIIKSLAQKKELSKFILPEGDSEAGLECLTKRGHKFFIRILAKRGGGGEFFNHIYPLIEHKSTGSPYATMDINEFLEEEFGDGGLIPLISEASDILPKAVQSLFQNETLASVAIDLSVAQDNNSIKISEISIDAVNLHHIPLVSSLTTFAYYSYLLENGEGAE